MKKLDLRWVSNPDWCYRDENYVERLKPNAPKEAQDSYKHYLEQTFGEQGKSLVQKWQKIGQKEDK